MSKFQAIHGGADYVLPVMLTQDNAPITGTLVATYRVGAESVSRTFSAVNDIGIVTDPTNAAYQVRRYDCVISAADTATLGADDIVRLDINLTIGARNLQALGVIVPYYAYGGPVDVAPVGAYIVAMNERLIATVVNVLGAGTGGGTTDYNALSNKPTLGTAAPLNVAASGNAASGEVVKGNDSRLGGGMAIDGSVTGGTDGSVPYISGGNLAQQNAGLYYDPVTKRLCVGHANDATFGSVKLAVKGAGGSAYVLVKDANDVGVLLQDTSRPANERIWGFYSSGSSFSISGFDDAGTPTEHLKITRAGVVSAKIFKSTSYTLAALNSAYPAPNVGDRAFITNELTGASHAPAAGGGTLERPVYYGNGAWRIGG